MNIKNTGEDIEAVVPTHETPSAPQVHPDLTAEANGNGDNGDGDDEDVARGSNVRAEIKKYMSQVAGIGREHGSGKRALVTLAQTIVEGAQEQVIKPDAAQAFYKKFRDASDKKATIVDGAVIGGSEGSWKSQVSRLRTFIKLGNEYRDDATAIIQLAAEVHAKLVSDDATKAQLKLSSTYSALLEVAREHLKEERKGVPMTEEELHSLFLGKEPKEKTGADYIEAAIKSCKQAQKGREASDASTGRDPVLHAGLERALDELKQVLHDIDLDRYNAMVKAEQKATAAAAKAAAEEEAAEAAE